MKFSPLALFFFILLSGCKDKCLKGTGEIIKQKRELSHFSSVMLYDNINLVILPGTTQNVEVEAGEKLQENISTEVINYQLIIKNNNTCDWLRSYKKEITVYITQANLVELYNYSTQTVSNSGQLLFDSLIIHNYGNGTLNMNIKCDKLNVDTNHLGDVIISGEANQVAAHCFRLARLDTRNLKCQNLTILSEAEGDMFVYAENYLKGTIKSIGNIYYYGDPVTTDFQDYGEGNFIKK